MIPQRASRERLLKEGYTLIRCVERSVNPRIPEPHITHSNVYGSWKILERFSSNKDMYKRALELIDRGKYLCLE